MQPTDLLTTGQIVAVIARRDVRRSDYADLPRDRAAKLVQDAIRRGQLVQTKPGYVALVDFATWARNKTHKRHFARLFDDLPAKGGEGSLTLPALTASGRQLPNDVESCRKALTELYARVAHLEVQLREARAKVVGLEPDALRYRGN